MAIDDILFLKGDGNVDVQPGGPGNPWGYLSFCAALGGTTVPRGETERRWCQDIAAGKFRVSSKFKTAPDPITGELMTKLGKIFYLENLDCPFSLRSRYSNCGERDDVSQYELMLSYCDVDLNETSYDDLAVVDEANQDEILVTSSWAADYEMRVKSLGTPGRLGSLADLGDQPINDLEYCSEFSCGGTCGARSTSCSTWFAVTDLDAAPYAYPNLIKGVQNVLTDVITWTNVPIIGVNSSVEGIECPGNRLVISSNGDAVIGYNDAGGDQDEWTFVTLANAPTANNNALFFLNANVGYVGAVAGNIYKTVDGGVTWSNVHSATLTAENINAVFAFNKDLVYAAGDNGVMLKSTDGGGTWSSITETSTTGANILVITVPPTRSTEVYIGTNDGMIYRSINSGGTLAATGDFSAMTFDGQGVGTVDDLAWCGPCGSDVLWILHNDGGPRGRILRDLSGGNGANDVEVVANYEDIIVGGIQLNALACCTENEAMAAGENNGGFPVMIRTT